MRIIKLKNERDKGKTKIRFAFISEINYKASFFLTSLNLIQAISSITAAAIIRTIPKIGTKIVRAATARHIKAYKKNFHL